MEPLVEFARAGAIATITLNRPDKRNAFNTAMAVELEGAVDRVEADPELRVAILRAATTEPRPVFCAGYDVSEGVGDEHGGSTERGGFLGITKRDRTKPIVVAVDGFAVGGGFELVLACDIVVASPRASFALAEVKWNLVAAGGGVFRLPRVVGRPVAMDMLLSAAPLSAERAYELGLVSRLATGEPVDDLARRTAEDVAANAPMAVRLTRRAVERAEELDDAAAWAMCDELVAEIGRSADSREGVQAFLERRAPQWTGN